MEVFDCQVRNRSVLREVPYEGTRAATLLGCVPSLISDTLICPGCGSTTSECLHMSGSEDIFNHFTNLIASADGRIRIWCFSRNSFYDLVADKLFKRNK